MIAVSIAVPASARERELGPTLASLAASAEQAARAWELVVAVNGPEEPSPAVADVIRFATDAGLPLLRDGDEERDTVPCVRLLRLALRSKVAAWNAIHDAARAPVVVYADADVRVDGGTVAALLARLDAEPGLAAVGGLEAPVLDDADGLAARAAALPYRVDFGNVPGRLYAIRRGALGAAMPADVIAEDLYLTLALGGGRIAREPRARVAFRPPATWRELLRQRVRHELGKLQLDRDFPHLERRGGVARTPWRALAAELRARDYPLAGIMLGVRALSRVVAVRRARGGFSAGWDVLPSTKRWPAAADARPAGGRP